MDRTLSDRIFPPVLLLLALAWLLPWMPAHAEAPAEWVALPLSERVMDATHTLDEATRQRLVEKLEALERRRGAQIAVVMLPTTGTLDIEAFSDKLFQAWKLGRKAVDDGLLLVVAKDDRRMRIEVGYGLEGAVPDVVAGRIIRERMAPAFREGDYAGGIEAAVDELIRLVDGETLPAAASSGAPKVSLGQLPAEAWALLVAFIYGSLAGVLLSARALRWPWLLGGALLCWLLGTLAGASGEWMSVLLVAPLCMLVGGATFGALWTVRPAFYLVIGVLVYVALLGLAAHWFSAVSFIYGLLWPAGVLMLAVLCWSNYRLMRSLWRERRKSFHRRLWALLAAYLLLGLLSGGLDAPLVWLALLPFQLMLGLLVFGQVRLSGGGWRLVGKLRRRFLLLFLLVVRRLFRGRWFQRRRRCLGQLVMGSRSFHSETRMSAITRYLAMLRLFGMLLCAAAIPSVATATVPVTVAVAASDVEEEAVEASAVGAEAEAARDAGYESAEVPALARRVTDLTATLDAAERARLEASLAALEARKGAQVAILMVPSTYPDSIEAYATRVFEAWKLGRKGIDDGVLVLVAKDDRRMRIEVGYGLEGTITDIDAGRIIREYMTPAFRQQDYAGGLEAAAQRLVRLIDGEALPPPPRDPLEPGAVRQTLAIAFLLGALGGVALLVRPRAWYWTLGAVVALAAALALGRHWPAGAMVALAEMVAVLGVGFGALLKYSRGARWFFAILVLYALGVFWAYRRYGLPVLHYGLAVPLSLGLTLLMLVGAWQGLRRGRRWAYLPGLLGLLLTLALECLLLLVDDPLNSIEALIILPAACLPLLIGCNFSAGGSGGGRRRGGDYASSSGSSSSSSSSSSSDSFSGGGGSSGGGGASGSW